MGEFAKNLTGLIPGLLGGGGDNGASAARQREVQRQTVANDQAAAQLNRDNAATVLDRRPRRGRRLFAEREGTATPAKKTLS